MADDDVCCVGVVLCVVEPAKDEVQNVEADDN